MSVEVWLAYGFAAAIMLAIPGPTVMLVIGYGLSEGRRVAFSSVIGVALGDLTAMLMSFIGLGAVLAASAELFTVVKWIGAAYLVYLGVMMWRSKPRFASVSADMRPRSGRAVLAHTYAVTALNPKGIVFFTAFVPQFINGEAPLLPQLVLLGVTFLILAIVNATLYAMLAGSLRGAIVRPSVLTTFNRLGGTLLIAAGVLTATLRRPA